MATKDIAFAYAGARVTRLVNREDVLDQIAQAVQDPAQETHVFYIEADGGMGKTFLGREVLRRCREGEWAAPDVLAARREVDLYHHQTHSREGFMAELTDVFTDGADHFAAYREQSRQLEKKKYDLRGAAYELKEQRRQLADVFLEDCAAMGEQQRVVLVLDTAEKLVYETDRVQQALELGGETFGMLPWLLGEWLPRMCNAVILICGRPNKRLAADLTTVTKAHSHIRLQQPKLKYFEEKDTLKYFKAVRETAERDSNVRALERLDAISHEARRVIHYLTEGRPIRLALMIDYYLITGRLVPEVKVSLDKLQEKAPEELAVIREKVEAAIVTQFQELGRPADEVIRALAWAPKGMDAALLARLTGLERQEAEDVLKELANPTVGLSFIKIRQPDRRAFLQDEMYALMKKHALDRLSEAYAEEVHEDILDYYATRIEAARVRVERLGRLERGKMEPDGRVVTVTAPGGPEDPAALAEAKAQLDNLLVEEIYYRLQADPVDGFETYCEYAEEAVTSNNESLDMQLRDEMLGFARQAFEEGQTKVRGLQRGDVERHAAVLWVWRNVYSANTSEAYRIARYLRTEEAAFLDEGGTLTWADLTVAEGWAAAFLGSDLSDLEETETRLRDTVEAARELSPRSPFERRRRDVLLAKAYNALGYLQRVQGRFQDACEAYRSALPLWRVRERESDHADTLNNLAYATAETGNFGRAMRYCQDGLRLREKLGYRYLIALSYNTLGLIAIKNDQPHRGRVHSERALAIFRDLELPRGIGLAYTALAEAHRRSADTPDVYFAAEKAERLRFAEEFATLAVDIFREEVPEKLRLVEALNELGCVYRNWACLWPEYHEEDDPSQEELIEKGVAALEETARLAGDVFPYRQVDALINLAWLHYYVGKPGPAVEVLDQAKAALPPDYCITRERGLPQGEDLVAFLWTQLGKAHLLQGQIALEKYENQPSVRGRVRDEALWREVARHFTLTLAYSELFADDYRGMRGAKNTMYRALRGINPEELRALYEGVAHTAQAYNLEHRPGSDGQPARPRMRNFLEEYFGTPEEFTRGSE